MRTFEVTRQPEHEGSDDFLILVDGQRIGGTYPGRCNVAQLVGWGRDDGGQSGENWISYGPRGLSCGHPTREAAEQAQVREYATDPGLFDRLFAMDRAERAAEAATRQAERDAEYERRAAERRRRRLGDDEPGPVTWTLPVLHALYADLDEVDAVIAWLEANGIEHVSSRHEARVEQRATRRVVVFEKVAWVYNGRGTDSTKTHVVTIVTDPPAIAAPPRPDMHAVFAEHWPSQFPLIDFGQSTACGKCTREAKASTADMMVPWPCAPVEKAIANGR